MNGKIFRIFLALALASLLVLTFAGLVGADRGSPEAGPPSYIVVFQGSVASPATQQAIVERAGGQWLKPLRLINAAAVRADPVNKKALEAHPSVLRVDEDVIVRALGEPVAPQAKPPKPTPTPGPAQTIPWGVDRIDADLAWGKSTGAGVKVAVLDTGIDLDHPDLKDNVKAGFNAINPRKSANDDNGHGTHVAGIIAAVDNTVGVVGVAPEAHLYAVKVLGASGIGFLSDIIEGLQWCVDHGIQVANMSLGTSSDIQSFHDAITAAYDAGIVLVAAAGNSGPGDDTVEYPAKYPEVIAVSAVDSSDTIASFSSRGPEVELTAPGVDIYSTWKGGGYATASGTSMATPHVSGTAALVVGTAINDDNGDGRINDEVRARLQVTADDLGESNQYGYGLVDAEEAATGTESNP